MFHKLLTFMTHLDKQALRAVCVVVLMGLFVVALIILGRTYLGVSESEIAEWFERVRGTVWALPLVIVVFCLAAFVGIPQWALIAGTVVAFGPTYGALFSWVAALISASLDFWLARYMGAERLKRFGGDLINRITALVRKKGFFTSFMVRLVPTGPFVLVNMAAGVSQMKFTAFLAGTALGILPKIVAVAFIGNGLLSAYSGQRTLWIVVSIAAAVALIVGMLWARARLKRRLTVDPV